MPRQLRAYLPGGIFHVTARTQGKSAWFDEAMRDRVCEMIALVQQRSDVRIAAFVVMPNHLHFVLQQRDLPISCFMHPLLSRIAAAVKLKYSVEGHIFERRYWDRPCMSPEYAHHSVRYVHHNPVEAGLCVRVEDYAWSSHAAYAGGTATHPVIVEPLTEMNFSEANGATILPALHRPGYRPDHDLGLVIDRVLREFEPRIDIDMLINVRGRRAAQIRRACIRRASALGYRNCQIARYLKISDSVVSKVVVVLRQNCALGEECLNGSKSEADKQPPKK